VVPRLQQLEHGVEGGQAGAEGYPVGGALETRHVPLQRLAGRVLGPGVFVASVLTQ